MELILTADVKNVGRKGDVIRVRDGFARNFLLPRRWAITSTRANRQFVEEQKQRNIRRREKEKEQALNLAENISKIKVTLQAKAGEKDKLFGSITAEDICAALNQQGYTLERKQILLKESLRSLGAYPVSVEIYPQVKATVTVEIIRES